MSVLDDEDVVIQRSSAKFEESKRIFLDKLYREVRDYCIKRQSIDTLHKMTGKSITRIVNDLKSQKKKDFRMFDFFKYQHDDYSLLRVAAPGKEVSNEFEVVGYKFQVANDQLLTERFYLPLNTLNIPDRLMYDITYVTYTITQRLISLYGVMEVYTNFTIVGIARTNMGFDV